MNDLQALLQRQAHEQVRALDEFARGSPVELLELPDEMGLVEIRRGCDIAPIGQLLPGQAIGLFAGQKFA
ncbi:hypothetical protein HJO_07717 [Hyphomonas johnsonii MHS-2]|uniref:Uncharacterized protein n=1 Tax=Hyphomonas johnsonii MHS-2 TaxID=1280950 RepID=A0A059FQ68_9PROT|nr:hypothetical protein [Hyphomonas johnsonii]KCZ92825.1 hypothetical protein HJO_07717 [Hyphomonas johnsonii MHS-2]